MIQCRECGCNVDKPGAIYCSHYCNGLWVGKHGTADAPDDLSGWKVVKFGNDGSVLIDSPTGRRMRVKVEGTTAMQEEIKSLQRQLAATPSKAAVEKAAAAIESILINLMNCKEK